MPTTHIIRFQDLTRVRKADESVIKLALGELPKDAPQDGVACYFVAPAPVKESSLATAPVVKNGHPLPIYTTPNP